MREDEQVPDLVETFVSHRAQLCHAAAKILKCRDRAEDVVQDAYLKIIEVRSIFDVKQPVAYLFRVVRNLAIDYYRRASLESTMFATEEEGYSTPCPGDLPEEISINRQQLSRIACALDQLPERTKMAFELCRMGGFTQREIAKMLNVSPTLVNFMIRDALDQCRQAVMPP